MSCSTNLCSCSLCSLLLHEEKNYSSLTPCLFSFLLVCLSFSISTLSPHLQVHPAVTAEVGDCSVEAVVLCACPRSVSVSFASSTTTFSSWRLQQTVKHWALPGEVPGRWREPGEGLENSGGSWVWAGKLFQVLIFDLWHLWYLWRR